MARSHLIRLALLCAAVALPATAGGQQPAATPSPSTFTVFFRSVPIGSEQIAVARAAGGWTVTSSGRLGAPLDLVNKHMQIRYDPDWKPLELIIDATVNGQALSIHTTVNGTTATSDATNAGQPSQSTDTIAADAI